MRPLLLIAALALCAASCHGSPARTRLAQVHLQTSFGDGPVRILLGDALVGAGDAHGPLELRLPDVASVRQLGAELFAEVSTPCGPARVKLALPKDGWVPSWLDAAALPRTASVFVDNREGPARTLALGAQAVRLGANEATRRVFYEPACAEGREVRSDAAGLGALPPALDAARPAYFVDLKGGRCYLSTGHAYQQDGSRLPADRRPADFVVAGRQVYAVPWITDYLRHAPSSFVAMGEAHPETGRDDLRRDFFEQPCTP
jgi:hypothetical protein